MDRETKTERETEGRAEKGKRPTMPLTISGRCTMTTQLKLADLTDRSLLNIEAYESVTSIYQISIKPVGCNCIVSS